MADNICEVTNDMGCCNQSTDDNVLNYTVDEINKILYDSIINCSVRYSQCIGVIRNLTLNDAIILVPEKDRSISKLITFLNKDEEPKPELWVFGGSNISEWLDISKWTNIPTDDKYSSLYETISDLEIKLEKEITDREEAISELDDKIEGILGNPDQDISTLNKKLDSEITNREEADKAVREYLTQLIQDTANNINYNIGWEAKKRKAVDKYLFDRIKALDPDDLPTGYKYVISQSVKAIEVVDKAPLIKDNTIYFELEPMPDQSTYGFLESYDGNPKEAIPVLNNVTLITDLIGKNGVNRVRILFGIISKPSGSNISISASFNDELFEFSDTGYIGGENGFNIPADYEGIIPITMTFSKAGSYSYYLKLVEVDSGIVLSEKDTVITCYTS